MRQPHVKVKASKIKIKKNKIKVHSKVIKKNVDLFSFIIWWEWSIQLKAFCDSYIKKNWHLYRKSWRSCTRWSIWYWTKSYWWEVITKSEAHKRMQEYLNNVYVKIPDCWTKNQKIAITDYQYQFWSYSHNINKYIKRCSYKDVKHILYPYWKWYSKWIKKRRVRWYNLFIN